MIRHLFKLVWNRKRSNLLLVVELFFSFLVLAAVVTSATHLLHLYHLPVGFTADDVWSVEVGGNRSRAGEVKEGSPAAQKIQETTRVLFEAVRGLPEVLAVAGAGVAPFATNHRGSETHDAIAFERNDVTDDFARAIGLEITRGRFFGKEDDGAADVPVVINERLARLLGDGDPVGRRLDELWKADDSGPTRRVVGVMRDYRQDGELGTPVNYLLRRRRLDRLDLEIPNDLVIKLRPGTTSAFEEKLMATLQTTARDWTFQVRRAARLREERLNDRLEPLVAVALVASALLLMVAMGLTGVVWQNVTQRTRELGLRRAKGATRGAIQRQIIGELAVMTTLAVGAGLVVLAQVPLLDLIGPVTGAVYLTGLAVSALCIYGLTMMCGWYPAWLATRVPPALALHHE